MKRLLILALVLAPLTVALAADLGTIRVRWNLNVEPDIAGYRLYRQTGPDTWELIGQQIPHPTDHADYVPPAEGAYTFVLTAVDTSGNESGHSNEATAVINVPPAPPTGCRAEVIP